MILMDKKWLKNPVNSDKTLQSLDLRTMQTLMLQLLSYYNLQVKNITIWSIIVKIL